MNDITVEDELLARVRATIMRHRMLAPDDKALAAVSGGLDSLVMLHVLRGLGYRVTAAHFDHHTRGKESKRDAVFVQDACKALSIPVVCGGAHVKRDAQQLGRSFEAYARERRYAFLIDAAQQSGCSIIATAHHEHDQAETMLMGILGLASSFGMTGIAPVVERDNHRIVRPLIDCSRNLIKAWAIKHGITWREDQSNIKPCYVRNRVRHEFMPMLEEYNSGARRCLARAADIFRVDQQYLDETAAKRIEQCMTYLRPGCPVMLLDRTVFRESPEAVQRHMIKALAIRININITHERILQAIAFMHAGAPGKMIDLGDGAMLYADKSHVHVLPAGATQQNKAWKGVRLSIPGETRVPGYRFVVRCMDTEELQSDDIRRRCAHNRQYFDMDALGAGLRLRRRRPGDRMRPLGMGHARKIQDIMTDCSVPAYLRDATPLVTMGKEILWIAGWRRGDAARINAATKQLLEIRFEYED